jgi:hypothetical protein
MPLLIFIAMAVFAPGLVFFLLHLSGVVVDGIPPVAYVVALAFLLLFLNGRKIVHAIERAPNRIIILACFLVPLFLIGAVYFAH